MTGLDKAVIRKTAWLWWNRLQSQPTKDGNRLPGDRATLAKLRRAGPLEAACEPTVIRLYDALGFPRDAAVAQHMLPRVAVLASLLANVRDDAKVKLARSLGPPPGAKYGEGAALSALRLRRLLAARGNDEIAIAFRRALAMVDHKANVGDLAWQVMAWDRDELGDRTRTLFAFDYHNAGEHAPPATADASTSATADDTVAANPTA
jgi:CRISPR system Cascade subunit CasB